MIAALGALVVLVVGFLLASVPLYGLIGIARTPGGAEAAMKTYLLEAIFGILLLFGTTLLYGVAGTTAYAELTEPLTDDPAGVLAAGVVAVLAGPGHRWVGGRGASSRDASTQRCRVRVS